MIFNSVILDKAQEVSQLLRSKNLKITFAESCTGGLLSSLFTEIKGASDVFDCGFVTYSNEAKISILDIDPEILNIFGAVSSQTAEAMAIGVLAKSKSNIAISITGIAGPNGGSWSKPVGLVYIGLASKNKVIIKKFNFLGSRSQIREATIISALDIIYNNTRFC